MPEIARQQPNQEQDQGGELVEFPGLEAQKKTEKEPVFEGVDMDIFNQALEKRAKDLPKTDDEDEMVNRFVVAKKFRKYAEQNVIDTVVAEYLNGVYNEKIDDLIGKSNQLDQAIIDIEEKLVDMEKQAAEADPSNSRILDEIQKTKLDIKNNTAELDTIEGKIESVTSKRDAHKKNVEVRPLFDDIMREIEAEERISNLQEEENKINRMRAFIEAGVNLDADTEFNAMLDEAMFIESGKKAELEKHRQKQAEKRTLEALKTENYDQVDIPTLQRLYTEGTLTQEQYANLPPNIQMDILSGAQPVAPNSAERGDTGGFRIPTKETPRSARGVAEAQSEKTPPPKKGLLKRLFGRN